MGILAQVPSHKKVWKMEKILAYDGCTILTVRSNFVHLCCLKYQWGRVVTSLRPGANTGLLKHSCVTSSYVNAPENLYKSQSCQGLQYALPASLPLFSIMISVLCHEYRSGQLLVPTPLLLICIQNPVSRHVNRLFKNIYLKKRVGGWGVWGALMIFLVAL